MRTTHEIDVYTLDEEGDATYLPLKVTKDDTQSEIELQIGRGTTVSLTPSAVADLVAVLHG